jgi:hypothetical protein
VIADGGSFSDRRQQRLRAYVRGNAPVCPAGVAVDVEAASTTAGQAGALTAANLLARAHQTVVLAVPEVPLLVPSPLGGKDLREACARIVSGVDASNRVEIVTSIPDSTLSLGIGARCGRATVYCAGRRWTAVVAEQPVETTLDPSSLIGLGLAVMEAAAVIFRMALGAPVRRNASLSLWTLDGVAGGAPTGPADSGPVDVGRVWLVGAGAVGSCLAWWLGLLGVVGTWTVIDADIVKDLNLDRSLAFFAHHTAEFGGQPEGKSAATSALIPGAQPINGWWSDWVATDPPSPDLIVLAANEHGVRPAVATYSHPAVIAATTSRNWTAELHRHLVLRDGCVSCRFPESAPVFECATGSIDPPKNATEASRASQAEPSNDASLPFLSATAGLLAATGTLHIQHGHWVTHDENQWAFGFDSTAPALVSRIWPHWASCATVADVSVRRSLHRGTRWAKLDPQLNT